MLMGFVSITYAQTSVKSFKVHFNSDEYLLDQTDKNLLDNLIKEMNGSTYSEVSLKAHTDQDADASYNIDLSKKRAESVSNYLRENGIGEKRITEYCYGESKLLTKNNNDKAKAENRRVEIVLNQFAFTTTTKMLKLIGGETKQVFKIKHNTDNTIIAKNGLRVVLPKGSLETVDGSPLSNAEITLEVEEFFKPQDAATQSLSTVCDGKILETGGMFSIKAFQKGKELQLKNDKPMQVDLPSENLKNNMTVFFPVTNAQGIVEWKNSAQPFEVKPKEKIVLPFTELDTKTLQTKKVMPDMGSLAKLNYTYKAIAFPKKPAYPRRPTYLKRATYADNFSWIDRIFYSKATMDKWVIAENKKRDKINENSLTRYNRKLDTYYIAQDAFQRDSAAFETSELQAFKDWLNQEEKAFKLAKQTIEEHHFNRGIDKVSEASKNQSITSVNPRAVFEYMSKPSQFYYAKLESIDLALNYIEILKTMSLGQSLKYLGNKRGEIYLGAPASYKQNIYKNYASQFRSNEFAAKQLNEDKDLATIFDNAQMDIMQKREKMGLLTKKDIGQIYSASLSNFGMVNCDRFSDIPPTQMASIEINCEGEARISFYVKDIQSFVYAYHDKKKNYHLELPINKQMEMVVLTFNKKGEPLYERRSVTFDGDETIEANPQVASIFDIRKSLASL